MSITIKSPIDDITGGKGQSGNAANQKRSTGGTGKPETIIDKSAPAPSKSNPSIKTPGSMGKD